MNVYYCVHFSHICIIILYINLSTYIELHDYVAPLAHSHTHSSNYILTCQPIFEYLCLNVYIYIYIFMIHKLLYMHMCAHIFWVWSMCTICLWGVNYILTMLTCCQPFSVWHHREFLHPRKHLCTTGHLAKQTAATKTWTRRVRPFVHRNSSGWCIGCFQRSLVSVDFGGSHLCTMLIWHMFRFICRASDWQMLLAFSLFLWCTSHVEITCIYSIHSFMFGISQLADVDSDGWSSPVSSGFDGFWWFLHVFPVWFPYPGVKLSKAPCSDLPFAVAWTSMPVMPKGSAHHFLSFVHTKANQ